MDEEGRILDDGSQAVRPRIGTHYRDVPKILMGIDPLVVLGRLPCEKQAAE